MSYLYLVRHAKSEWNEKGLWTGWADPHLSKDGMEEALKIGEALKHERFDRSYTPPFVRAEETLSQIEKSLGESIPNVIAEPIKERNYGVFTGKNKWEVKKEVGDHKFIDIRRGWNCPIKNGESLKDVYNRVVPFYQNTIVKDLVEGKNVIIVSSGNTLRALIKYLDNIPDDKIAEIEVAMGAVIRYQFDASGKLLGKETIYDGTKDKEKESQSQPGSTSPAA